MWLEEAEVDPWPQREALLKRGSTRQASKMAPQNAASDFLGGGDRRRTGEALGAAYSSSVELWPGGGMGTVFMQRRAEVNLRNK